MSTTELDEVMRLLERILPDPAGYGRRLIQQVVLQWAGNGEQPHPVVPGESNQSAPADLLAQVLRAGDPYDGPGRTEGADLDDQVGESPVYTGDVQEALAIALGACDCWGLRASCPTCGGAGLPGWTDPDPELFQKYVGPATTRLSAVLDGPSGDESRAQTNHHDRLREGANP